MVGYGISMNQLDKNDWKVGNNEPVSNIKEYHLMQTDEEVKKKAYRTLSKKISSGCEY